jgi:hypothetical protein
MMDDLWPVDCFHRWHPIVETQREVFVKLICAFLVWTEG